MNSATAAAITDIVLSAGTIALAVTVGDGKPARTWRAAFVAMSIAAALGVVYHGTERFHTAEFWMLVSGSVVASALLFVGACAAVGRPVWTSSNWFWPSLGATGILLVTLLAPLSLDDLIITGGGCLLLSAFLVTSAASRTARNFIYSGMAVTVLGFVISSRAQLDGIVSRNALLHLAQLTGNVFYWVGARRTTASTTSASYPNCRRLT